MASKYIVHSVLYEWGWSYRQHLFYVQPNISGFLTKRYNKTKLFLINNKHINLDFSTHNFMYHNQNFIKSSEKQYYGWTDKYSEAYWNKKWSKIMFMTPKISIYNISLSFEASIVMFPLHCNGNASALIQSIT